ncbi:MAG: hypothetical protein ACXVAX_08715 [Pseudobdellovibrio sp.]
MDIHNLALRPNCLMTRFPLVFLNGPRSLFFHEKLGTTLQDYVAAHGYVVLYPPLAFRHKKLRSLQLENFLRQQNQSRFHFILGPQTESEFADLFKKYPGSTFTNPESLMNAVEKPQSVPLSYKLHSLFSGLMNVEVENYNAVFPVKNIVIYERFLDRCVELAENE